MPDHQQRQTTTQGTARQDNTRVAGDRNARGSNQTAQQQLQARQEEARRAERARWEGTHTDQKDRAVDPTVPRWRELSAAEIAARAQNPTPPVPAGQRGHTAVVNGKTYLYDVQAHDASKPTKSKDLMGGDASQFYSRAMVTSTPNSKAGQPPVAGLSVLNADGTVGSQTANKDGMVELPSTGFGYETHNRNDVRSGGKPQPDQWGTPDAVGRTMNIAADYRTMYPNSNLSIGDLSTDTGNSPLLETGRSARHGSHYSGSQADLSYVGAAGPTNVAPTRGADLDRQRSMVRVAENWGMNNFYAGTGLRDKLYVGPDTTVGYNAGHNDHLHMGRGTGRN
jgi:hypothetical protein